MMLELDEGSIINLFSKFRCSTDPDAEYFLKNRSIEFEKKDVSRTYLLVTENEKLDHYHIHGYFSIAIKCLSLTDPSKIPFKLYELMNVNKGIAQSYLLGQLAKTDGEKKGLGREMIHGALDIFARGNDMFGCRLIRLDCKDQPKLLRYYESCGFISIGKNRDETFNQMVTTI